jgi:exodeoxyribonuclease V alpha subunit
MPLMVGDRVIQTVNNYDLEIFNGDIGRVLGLSEKKGRLVVEFEDIQGPRMVEIPPANLEDLQLAYALTVHKSQGSEFPCVVMPIHTTNHIMLKRNLLYTAVTRARKMIVLVGTMKAVSTAIRTLDSSTRWSNLEKLITDGVPR